MSVFLESAVYPRPDNVAVARVAHLRESVRLHKERAVALWGACVPEKSQEPEVRRASMGRFTRQLAQCDG